MRAYTGAVVHAGPAADALQRGTEVGVAVGLAAAVVQQDQVQLARPVELARAARAGDGVEVGRHRLPGGRAREQAEQRQHMLEALHHLLDAGDGDVHLRHRGAHAAVALVPTSTSVPVSATMKLTPGTPIFASRNSLRSTRRPMAMSSSTSSV
jgi:hypothetical protein